MFYLDFFASGRFRRNLKTVSLALCLGTVFLGCQTAAAQVLGDPMDVSADFQKPENVYFIGSRADGF